MTFLNSTVSSMPPSGIRKFFDLVISAGPEVVSLGVGEPDFPTPWHIREAVIFALEKGFTSYSENAGLMELRKEIGATTEKKTGQKYDPKTEIFVTNGVSEGMDLAFRALVQSGDIVLTPDPGYVMYAPLAELAGGQLAFYNPADLSTLKIPENAKAIVLNFPGNPMGNVFSESDLKQIAEKAEKHNLCILSDEIYGELSFLQPHKSMVEIPGMRDRTVLFDGLSKSHSMTGFRIGWACGPADIIGGMIKIHQYSALCACTPSQVGAVEALRRGNGELEEMRRNFDERRKFCIRRLKQIGIPCHEPQGAFYIFADISGYGLDDVTFCEKLLKDAKLAIVPGSAFGSQGKGYVRMTYAESLENLEEAFRRLEKFWKKNA